MCSVKMPKIPTGDQAKPAAPPPPPEESATEFEPAFGSSGGLKRKSSGGNGLRIRLSGVR